MTEHLIRGKEEQARDNDIQVHLAAIDGMLNTHKMAIVVLNQQLDRHYKEQEHPNHIYMELINCQITTHCAAVSQVACQLALLCAMGVPGVTVPEIPSFNNGETVN